jgi:hypothetical protein
MNLSRRYPGIYLEGLRKTRKNLSQDCPNLDPNQTPPEYKSSTALLLDQPAQSYFSNKTTFYGVGWLMR